MCTVVCARENGAVWFFKSKSHGTQQKRAAHAGTSTLSREKIYFLCGINTELTPQKPIATWLKDRLAG